MLLYLRTTKGNVNLVRVNAPTFDASPDGKDSFL